MNERQAGILLPIASLPSQYGIGDFGKEAKEFVDLLSQSHFRLWQILPLNPLGYGHSPYQPFSSFALDELYVSLEGLKEKGLIENLPAPLHENSDYISYEEIRDYKMPYLKEAFAKEMEASPRCLIKFAKDEPWVKDYAAFMMFKRVHPSSWDSWPEEKKGWIKDRKPFKGEQKKAYDFEIWLQKTLYEQYGELHGYANKKGIQIIGDIPFYVGFDSVDVWANQDCFLLDPESKQPTFIAGVPPDYFSATGQRWGNPIYDWKGMKENGYSFIKERIRRNAKLYDIIRLDHFRAFDTYWKIPSSCPTAIDGKWIEAPGYELFDLLFKEDPSLQGKIIAEDLGDLRPEVLTLRDHYSFPGMNVIQFTFYDYEINLKGKWDEPNAVAYLGTHDNDTTLSYFYSLNDFEQAYWVLALEKYGIKEGSMVDRLIRYCLRKKAKYAILSMQDILELDKEARTNVPSTVDNRNWTWKLIDFAEFKSRLPRIISHLKEAERE